MAKTFRIKRRVQFAETDMAGVLHFATYYRYMEEVEHALWRCVGHSVMTLDGEEYIGWPRVSTQCKYFAPARFEDEIELVLNVAEVADQAVTYEIAFMLAGRRIAAGSAKAVCCRIRQGTFEAISIPQELRTQLEVYCSRRDD